ncbi:MAG: B12-binding domain-containing protein [Gemmataceae bacterium]
MGEHGAKQYLSTLRVSQALGVSVSTVKRWVDEGILPAHRTAGGHRKLLAADVLELARRGDLPQADLLQLANRGGAGEGKSNAGEPSEKLYRSLLAGKTDQVRFVLLGQYRTGKSIEELADQTIAPAMRRIGEDWAAQRIDVMEEHRASQICTAVLCELKGLIEARAGKTEFRAVGGSPEGDLSILPTLLVQMVLLDSGWEAINLGPNTPFASFAKAIVELRPRLLWLSVSHRTPDREFVQQYRKLFDQAERAGVAVALGGRALTESIRLQLPYTSFGDGLKHLSAFAKTLYPRPVPRRRGRPPVKRAE